MSQRAERMQEVWSASAHCCSLITEPNCLIRSETTKKPQCYTAPGQSLFFFGTGGRAQLCNSPVAWILAALLPCRRTQCLVWALPCAWPTWGPWAQHRRRLFASLQQLESLWFMWEIWEASDRANVVTVSKPTLRKCSCLGNCVCVCMCAGSLRNYRVEHQMKM